MPKFAALPLLAAPIFCIISIWPTVWAGEPPFPDELGYPNIVQPTATVVTGSNRGIDFATSRRLAELGFTVVLTGRDPTQAHSSVGSRSRWRVSHLRPHSIGTVLRSTLLCFLSQ